MESWLRVLLLRYLPVLALLGPLSGCAIFGGGDQPEDASEEDAFQVVVEPDIEQRSVKQPRIDSENFEVGIYGGVISVEDFGTNSLIGARVAYHITESFFAEATYGTTDVDRTSFELLSGAAELLPDDARTFSYYNLSVGYNILPGEIFIGRKRAWNSSLYLTAGAGSTEFAGDDRFTVSVGIGYRLLPKDWLAVHADVRDHIFDIDLFGQEKTAHNIETHLGVTFFF